MKRDASARQLRGATAAFTFLTRIPLGRLASHDPSDLPASAVYFPIVGAVVALFGGAAFVVSHRVWSVTVAVLLSTCATVLLTGAFHEDALADALDGLGGGWSRDQILSIMKDSRVGSYALVGVVLVLGLKVTALSALAYAGDAAVVRALVAGHVLGRWSSIPLIWRYPYIRPTTDAERPSAGRPFAPGVDVIHVAAATAIAVLLVLLSLKSGARAPLVVAFAVMCLAGWYFKRRIGGITGDLLGAANQLVEVCVYLALAARIT